MTAQLVGPAVYSAASVRAIDQRAIATLRVPGETLMERAGTTLYGEMRMHWPRARRVAVFVGAGNNAGDGYTAAILARRAGIETRVFAQVAPERLHGEAAVFARHWLDGDAATYPVEAFRASDFDLVIDALLGTGLTRSLEAEWLLSVQRINDSGLPVLAADIPSGLSADTGAVMPIAVRAERTVTFVARKLGLYTGQGPEYTGEIVFDRLGVPETLQTLEESVARLMLPDGLGGWLPRRSRVAHKGSHGRVLVVGGAPGYTGAARLAALAAARSGAGLVAVATHPDSVAAVSAGAPEVMVRACPEGANLARDFAAYAPRVTVCGPGLGIESWGRGYFEDALEEQDAPRVLDADALNLLAESPRRLAGNTVITPHPGEAARLLGKNVEAVEHDRVAAALELAERFACVVVLKGAGSLVVEEDSCRICTAGNPGMATGGMGDVLAGIIGALLAQGLDAFSAASAGVLAHANAGDRAAARGQRGLVATDVISALPAALNANDAGIPIDT